jgi:hypothetical protein
MKNFIINLIALTALYIPANADFQAGELPISGFSIDTAYVLPEHGWALKESFPEITMPVEYGAWKGLQLGTNAVSWLAAVSNASLKWNIFPEGEMPAFSVGGAFAAAAVKNFQVKDGAGNVIGTIDKVAITYFNITGYLSKKIGDLYVSGSFTYNKATVTLTDSNYDPGQLDSDFMTTMKYYTGEEDPLGMTNMALSFMWQCTPSLRLLLEGLLLVEEPFAYYTAGGFIWAMGDTFRLEAGLGSIRMGSFKLGFPHLGLGMRF